MQNLYRIHSSPDFFDYEDTELEEKWRKLKQDPQAMKEMRNVCVAGVKTTAECFKIMAPIATYIRPEYGASISAGSEFLNRFANSLKYEEL